MTRFNCRAEHRLLIFTNSYSYEEYLEYKKYLCMSEINIYDMSDSIIHYSFQPEVKRYDYFICIAENYSRDLLKICAELFSELLKEEGGLLITNIPNLEFLKQIYSDGRIEFPILKREVKFKYNLLLHFV
ncbi:MAG: hypothetical protein Solivirus1_24 [Solivirus sp.]|uniref:Uncharacterized protein n=1 Tax=Solivirus sp. TaxID=2487772 RepID=A0A3G5AFB2_9VIRU|nr:MAG: hypothetical protein Solivirus1_24 [Solivirus sp.]